MYTLAQLITNSCREVSDVNIVKKIFIIQFLLAIVLLCSCGKENSNSYIESGRDESRMWYDSEDLILSDSVYDYAVYNNCFYDEDFLYIDVSLGDWEDDIFASLGHKVYAISLSDYKAEETIIDTENTICAKVGNEYACLSGSKIFFFDAQDGSYIGEKDLSNLPYIYNIYSDGEYYYLMGEGYAGKYSFDNECVDEIYSDFLTAYDSPAFFESDGECYAVTFPDYAKYYYKLDFDSGNAELVLQSSDTGLEPFFLNGNYYADGMTVKKINFTTRTIYELTNFDLINVKPQSGRLYTNSCYVVIDDETFVQIYPYVDGTTEIVIYSYNDTVSTAYNNIIEVGGYELKSDLPLSWAVYLFNTSHSDYRVVLRDYGLEGYAYSDGESAESAKAALISLFMKGDSPDIFYGSNFDYNSFGKSGLACDISEYVKNFDSTSSTEITQPVMNLIMNSDDTCYQMFPAYRLSGYFADMSYGVTDMSISIDRVQEIANANGIGAYTPMAYYQLLDSILRYEVTADMSLDDGHSFSIDELIKAIVFTVKNSYPDLETAYTYGTYTDYLLEPAVFSDIYVYSQYYRDKLFVGYPSIDDSNHVAEPVGLCAISESCDNKDLAWEFISLMFSDEVQSICAVNGLCPVSVDLLDTYLRYVENPDLIPEDDLYFGFINTMDGLDTNTISDYQETILSIDTLQTYDWGIFNIISDEISAYDNQGKSTEEIAQSLQSRFDVYIAENYDLGTLN